VDAGRVRPGQEIPATIDVENVYLILPEETPPADQAESAGHIQVYLDDLDRDPVLITASTQVTLSVPATIEPGDHKFICRVHKHDRTPTDAKVEIEFTVTTSIAGS
jgi:hypothetical protein